MLNARCFCHIRTETIQELHVASCPPCRSAWRPGPAPTPGWGRRTRRRTPACWPPSSAGDTRRSGELQFNRAWRVERVERVERVNINRFRDDRLAECLKWPKHVSTIDNYLFIWLCSVIQLSQSPSSVAKWSQFVRMNQRFTLTAPFNRAQGPGRHL